MREPLQVRSKYCSIDQTFHAFGKIRSFRKCIPFDSSIVDKRTSWIILYFVKKTLGELSLDPSRHQEAQASNEIGYNCCIEFEKHKSVHP